ncbi:MAG: cyclic nucleotide-binding domain-containing protein [Gaiellales bacterium]
MRLAAQAGRNRGTVHTADDHQQNEGSFPGRKPSEVTLVRGDLLYQAIAEAGFGDPHLATAKADIVARLLGEVPLLASLGEADRRRIAQAGRIARVSAGQRLVHGDDRSEVCYVLLTGSATIRCADGSTRQLRRGECLGHPAAPEHVPRSASVTADRDLWLLRLTGRKLAHILETAQ